MALAISWENLSTSPWARSPYRSLYGFLVFGIALFRAGLFPKWAILLMTAGAAIGGPQGLLPPVVAYGAMLALGLGIAGLGYALWTSVDGGPAERPPADLAVQASEAPPQKLP